MLLDIFFCNSHTLRAKPKAGFVSTQHLELQLIMAVIVIVKPLCREQRVQVWLQVLSCLAGVACVRSFVGNCTLKTEDFLGGGVGKWESVPNRAAGKCCNGANRQYQLWGTDSTLRKSITFPAERVHASGWGIWGLCKVSKHDTKALLRNINISVMMSWWEEGKAEFPRQKLTSWQYHLGCPVPSLLAVSPGHGGIFPAALGWATSQLWQEQLAVKEARKVRRKRWGEQREAGRVLCPHFPQVGRGSRADLKGNRWSSHGEKQYF